MQQQNENNSTDPILYREPSEANATQTYAIPDRALNVEAATLSLLEDTDQGSLDKFASFQATPRDEKIEWIKDSRSNVQKRYDEFVRTGMTGILMDTNIPPDTRLRALEGAPVAEYAPSDPAIILKQAGAIAKDSTETHQGAKVRSVFADQALKSWSYVDEKQQIVNAALGERDGLLGQVLDTASMFMPLQDAIIATKVVNARGGPGRPGAAFLPGSAIQKMNKEFLKLDNNGRLEFTKAIADIVVKNSGVLSEHNQMLAESVLQQITDEHGMSDGEAIFSNVLNLLDLIGVGVGVRSVLKTGAKAAKNYAARSAKARSDMAASASWFERQGVDIPMESGVPEDVVITGDSTVPPPKVSKYAKEKDALEAQLTQDRLKSDPGMTRDEYEEARSSLSLIQNNKERLPPKATPGEVLQFSLRQQEREKNLIELQKKVGRYDDATAATERIASAETRLEVIRNSDEVVPMEKNIIAAMLDRQRAQTVFATTNPRAPGNILASVNFEKGQTLYAQTIMDETGQLAEALYGTSRNEAIISQVAPQVTDVTGRVTQKMDNPERVWRQLISQGLDNIQNNIRDGLRYTPRELEEARSNVVKDYTDATGLKLNDGMTAISYDGAKVTFNGVYTNGQGGWASAEEVLEQVRFALKDRNVTDDNLTIMKLEGDEFKPTTLDSSKGQEGVYAVQIKVDDYVKDSDIEHWDNLDVKRNFLDRFETSGKNRHGSWQRHLFDPGSSLHKTLTGSMAVSEDKSALITKFLLERFKGFSDEYVKLDKTTKAAVDEYIRQANIQELPFDATALRNRFPQKVVDLLQNWRDNWDGMYMLENFDVMASLTHEGYQLFKHSNIEAVVKKAHTGFVDAKIYDPATDSVSKMSDADRKLLKDSGGYIGQFRSPMNLNGSDVEFMIVRNTPTEHARAFNNNDRILNYRHGYYQVSYKAPKFVEEGFIDSAGKKVRKAVQAAASTKDAEAIAERMRISNPNSTFTVLNDERKISRNRDVYWELNSSFGRIAQRHRGKLLESSVGGNLGMTDDLILNPADSAVRASLSLGGRIAMRDTITTAKARFMQQYGHLLGDGYPKLFPASRDDIFRKGQNTTKELADARTTWEYINYMENGYINAMDEAYKLSLNFLADLAGLKGFDTVEKLLHTASDINPTGAIKGGVFGAYLASNPIRQWFVQGGQALRLVGYSHVHTPKVYGLMVEGITNPRGAFSMFVEETGMIQSIQRSNLIRGTLLEAANRQTVTGRMADQTLSSLRKVGFDVGEWMNTYASSAAVYEKYVREGLDVTKQEVKAQMHAEIRALNRNMNRAGDMPYNHNALALLFTYLQVPHKFATQWADRALSPAERARLIAADLTMWGLPAGVGAWVANQEFMQEFPHLKEIVEDGVNSMLLNTMLRKAYGEDTGVDLSSMAPYDLTGMGDVLLGMVGDGGWSKLIAESPAGRVLGLGTESRLGFAIKTTASMFTDFDGSDLNSANIGDVADAWLRLSSGWTNIQEAIIMHQLGKVVDKQGRIIDDNVKLPEVVAKIAGFGTRDSKAYYETMIKASDTQKKVKDRAKEDIKHMMIMVRHLNRGDMTGANAIARYTQMMSDRSNFPNDTLHRQYLSDALSELRRPANQKLMQKFTKDILPENIDDMGKLLNGAPITPREKEAATNTIKIMQQHYKTLEEANKGN